MIGLDSAVSEVFLAPRDAVLGLSAVEDATCGMLSRQLSYLPELTGGDGLK